MTLFLNIFYFSHCKQFKYIPKIAQGISKTNRLEAVIASTNLLIEELMQKKHAQYNALFELKCEEQESQQEVDDLYSRLYLHIYDLTKSESAKITTEFQSRRVAVEKDMQAVADK